MECIFAALMNEALLCIGSNENKEANITCCQDFLRSYFPNIRFSDTSLTAPYGSTYKKEFLNQLALAKTEKSKEEVVALLKQLEKNMGRSEADKLTGAVIIDIDLIVWNNEILKPTDYSRSYVSDLLPSLKDSFSDNNKAI